MILLCGAFRVLTLCLLTSNPFLVAGVSEDLEEECRAAIFHDNMDPSRLMVHAQQVEESRLRRSNRESNRANSFESGSSKSRLDVQDKPKFNKRFKSTVSSSFCENRNYRGSNPKPLEGRNVDRLNERPSCGKCGMKHVGECLIGTNSLYGCGKSFHMVKDCPNVRS